MYELTYNPNYLTNDYELGFTTDDGYLWMLNEDKTINQQFVEFLNGIQSFRLLLTTGTATCRFERGKHWYAYKKVRGKLNKAYIGKSTDFTDLLLNNVVASINIDKSDQPSKAIAKKSKPKSEEKLQTQCVTLAGNGKDDRYVQPTIPNLPTEDLQYQLESFKNIATEYQQMYHDECGKVAKLEEKLKSLKKQAKQLDLEEKLLGVQLGNDSLEAENILLRESLDKEKKNYLMLKESYESQFSEMNSVRDSQASLIFTLREDIDRFRQEISNYRNQIQQLEFEESKTADKVTGYFFMYQELSDQVFNIRTVIEEFRLLAKGKDKRNHPRFAYLLDFLARIDNLS